MQSKSKSEMGITPNIRTGLQQQQQQQQQQTSTVNFHQSRPFHNGGRVNRSARLSNTFNDDMAERRKQLQCSNTTNTSCNNDRMAHQNGNKRNNGLRFMALFQNMKQHQQEQEQALQRQRKIQEHDKKSCNEHESQTEADNKHFNWQPWLLYTEKLEYVGLCYWSINWRSGFDVCSFARSGRCKFTCGVCGCGGIWCWML